MALRKMALCAMAVLLAAGCLLPGCGGSGVGGREITIDAPVTIVRTFEVGDTYKYKFKVKSQIGVMRTGFEQTIVTQTELRTTSIITSVTDEQVEATLRFDYAVGALASGDAMLPDESVTALRGKELELTLSPDGEFIAATGMANEAAFESGSGEFARTLSEVFPKLPKEPLSLGTTWTEPVDVPDPDREFVGEVTYTVIGFKEKYEIECVQLSAVTDFEFEGRASQGSEVYLMTGSGTSTGELLLSIDKGHIVFASARTILTLEAEGASVASAAASGTVKMGVTTESVIELI